MEEADSVSIGQKKVKGDDMGRVDRRSHGERGEGEGDREGHDQCSPPGVGEVGE
jgi:hypothetical protein